MVLSQLVHYFRTHSSICRDFLWKSNLLRAGRCPSMPSSREMLVCSCQSVTGSCCLSGFRDVQVSLRNAQSGSEEDQCCLRSFHKRMILSQYVIKKGKFFSKQLFAGACQWQHKRCLSETVPCVPRRYTAVRKHSWNAVPGVWLERK